MTAPAILSRCGDLLVLHASGQGTPAALAALADALAAAAPAPSPGRQLNRLLASALSHARPDEFPALCAIGPAGGGYAVAVYGPVQLNLTVAGERIRLDGRDAVTMIDRYLPGPVTSARAVLGDTSMTLPVALAHHAELPPGSADQTRTGATVAQVRQVLGVRCASGHGNDPRVFYCVSCGRTMTQADRSPVWMDRPPLGVLLVDDGTTLPLAHDHVLGGEPNPDPAVRAGQAVPVPLFDTLVSPVHARIVLVDWEVELADAGSANGTFVLQPDAPGWLRLPTGGTTRLHPGAVVALGRRRVRYWSNRAA
ncbi:MAG TPA: FHA domain-containing protein [Micromonosporaceae bacterium]